MGLPPIFGVFFLQKQQQIKESKRFHLQHKFLLWIWSQGIFLPIAKFVFKQQQKFRNKWPQKSFPVIRYYAYLMLIGFSQLKTVDIISDLTSDNSACSRMIVFCNIFFTQKVQSRKTLLRLICCHSVFSYRNVKE